MRTATAQVVELEAFRRKKEEIARAEQPGMTQQKAMQAGMFWVPVYVWMPANAWR